MEITVQFPLQLRGMADYVGMKQFRIERDLCLFDLLGSQKKEEFANAVTGRASANIMLHDVQLQMIAVLEALGYDGWLIITTHLKNSLHSITK